ncbi:MAG: iron complex transport system substrate-binding protein, partial [Glaciecola sp.]
HATQSSEEGPFVRRHVVSDENTARPLAAGVRGVLSNIVPPQNPLGKHQMNIITSRTTAALITASFLLAACGTSPEPAVIPAVAETATASDTGFPVTVEADNGPVELLEMPVAIVSLSTTATEMLFAIGAGDQVVAVDEQSNFPAEAPLTDLSGFQPNVEAILGFNPDLVIISYDPGDLVAALAVAQVPTIMHDAATTLADTYRQIEQLGVATGHVADAAVVVSGIVSDLDAVVESLPESAAGLTYYHELDSTYFTATSSTFIGELYALLGLENIADAADPDGSSFGFPQLSAEYIVSANPDLIFLADTKCCDVTAASVAARDGWSQMTAITTGGVIELDDDIASRWGPRVVEYLVAIAAAINQLASA